MRRRLGVASLVFVLAALPPVVGQADPLPPNSTIRQQWDLVAKQESSAGVSKTIPIKRGLIGGTTTMVPAPWVELFVVGKVQGATGTAKWTVEVHTANGVIGSTWFNASHTEFLIRPDLGDISSVTWPASPTVIESIKLVPSGVGVPGTFTLQKASLRLKQTGTIMATQGRLPIAPTQTTSSSSWVDIADPVLYKHQSQGFEPAPATKLRVVADSPSFPLLGEARLVDEFNNVVGYMSFGGQGQPVLASTSVALIEGRTYRLQVKSTQTNWKIHSAELEFDQSTVDPLGLESVVAWYPATATPVNLVTSGARTEHMIRPPQNDAELSKLEWIFVAKRNPGTGSVEARPTYEEGTQIPEMSLSFSGSLAITSQSYVRMPAKVVDPPIESDWWDTKPLLNNGATGRLAGSLFRANLRLRGTLKALSATEPAFSPGDDLVKDSTVITGEIHSDAENPTWEITIRQGADPPVHQATGTGLAPETEWHGTESNLDDGVALADGAYTATLSLPGISNAVRQVIVILDTAAPDIAYVTPSSGSNTMFSSQPLLARTLDEVGLSVQFSLKDSTTGTTTSPVVELYEDGWARTPPQTLILGHVYTLEIVATDEAGNTAILDQAQDPQGGFLATGFDSPELEAEASRTQCAVAPPESGASTRSVECQGLVLTLPASHISHAGSRHDGQGWVSQSVDLSSAQLVHPLASGGELTQPAYASGTTRDYQRRFKVIEGPAGQAPLAEIFEQLPPVVAEVPAAWDEVFFEMESVLSTIDHLACPDPSVATVGCGPDPAPVPEMLWDPPTPRHAPICDSALTHSPSLNIPASGPYVIEASLAPGVIEPASGGVSLIYRLGGGSQASISGTYSDGSVSFDLAGVLSPGDRIDYSIQITGSIDAQWCEDKSGIVAPSKFAYSALVEDDLEVGTSPTDALMNTATYVVSHQPAIEDPGALDATDVCALFAGLTPCDVFAADAAENPMEDGYEVTAPTTHSRSTLAAPGGGGQAVCIYGVSDDKDFWDATGAENKTESAPGLPSGLAFGRTEYTVHKLDGGTHVELSSTAGAGVYGKAKHWGYAKAGFVHGWEKASPSDPDEVEVIAQIYYSAVGDGNVAAGDVGYFDQLPPFTGPGPYAHAHGPGVAGGIYKLSYENEGTPLERAIGSYNGGWRPLTENWTAQKGRETPPVVPILWAPTPRHWNSGYKRIIFNSFTMQADVDYAFFARLRTTVEAVAAGVGAGSGAEARFIGQNEHGETLYQHRLDAYQLTLQRADGGLWAEC